MIAEETGADIFKIERANPYPTDYDECVDEAKKEQSDNARPELKNTLDNLDDYDAIYLGMPVWYGDMPMPVYTFIESLTWNGKTVYPFTSGQMNGLSGSQGGYWKSGTGCEKSVPLFNIMDASYFV